MSVQYPGDDKTMSLRCPKTTIMLRGGILVCVLGACHVEKFGSEPDGDQRILWVAGGTVSGQPATDAARVYYGTTDHQLIAVDRSSGAVKWRSRTDARSPRTLNGANVVIAGGNVVFGDYVIYGFDQATGVRRWVFDPEAQGIPGHAAGAYKLATDGSTIYAGSGSGHVYALSAGDGSLIWVSALSVDGQTSVYDPVIDGETLYVTVRHFTNPITGFVAAINRIDGRTLWSHVFSADPPTSSGPVGKVVPFKNTVIVANDDGKIYWLDKTTGATKWTAPRRPDVIGYNDLRPLILAANVLVAGSLANYLTGYDPETGAQIWETNSGQGSVGSPLDTDGVTVFQPNASGTLGAFDAATGARRWIQSAPNKAWFTPYPLVTDAAVFAPSTGGLVALEK